MSDLPERIAVKKLSGMLTLDSVNEPIWPDAPTTIYLRADLAGGYTRDQMRLAYLEGDEDAVCHEGGGGRYRDQLEKECERFLATMTPVFGKPLVKIETVENEE